MVLYPIDYKNATTAAMRHSWQARAPPHFPGRQNPRDPVTIAATFPLAKVPAMYPDRVVRFARFVVVVLAMATLAGCASWFGAEPLRVNVAGLEPLDSQGMEVRFNMKLRIQNPSGSAVSYSGISVDLEVNGKAFATGVSPASGTVPAFGEAIVSVPVTVSALAAIHQMFVFVDRSQYGQIEYILRGRLAGTGITGSTHFIDQGSLPVPFPYIGSDS
jgi:LEA14-like dessication related protein